MQWTINSLLIKKIKKERKKTERKKERNKDINKERNKERKNKKEREGELMVYICLKIKSFLSICYKTRVYPHPPPY